MIALAVLLAAAALAAPKDPAWEPLEFLVGEWIGEGSGEPGAATGGSAFRFDLDGRVLLRPNWASYPATKDRPAFTHKDLLIVYREGGLRAIYFDTEDHVIRYAVQAAAGTVQFLSDGSPRYRLTYKRLEDGLLRCTFEVAPPGKDFSVYLDAKLKRKR